MNDSRDKTTASLLHISGTSSIMSVTSLRKVNPSIDLFPIVSNWGNSQSKGSISPINAGVMGDDRISKLVRGSVVRTG